MNFLALLGWAPDGETTIMPPRRADRRASSLERVGASPATFDYEKLDWMNGVYLRALPPEEYAGRARRLPPRAGLSTGPRSGSAPPRRSSRRRSSGSASSPSSPAFSSSAGSSHDAAELDGGGARGAADALAELEPFTAEAIEQALRGARRPARARSRARRSSRSGSPSPARRSHPGCSRASSCSGARRRWRGSGAAHGGSGLGRASGSRARWNSRQARRLKRGVGRGQLDVLSLTPSTPAFLISK